MKTIEEKAYKYAEVTTWDDVDGYPSDIYATNAYNAYVVGATEQKAIDDAEWLKIKSSWEREAQINHNDKNNYKQGFHDAIEKACEWLDNYFMEIGYLDDWLRDSLNIKSGKERFRKAMEK